MILKRVIVAAIAATGLAACTSGGGTSLSSYTVYGEYFSPKYQFGDLQYYNNDKQMAVEVVNQPFDQSDAERRIATSMRGKNQGARIDFTAEPGPQTPEETKIIVAFGTEKIDSGRAYCGGAPISSKSGQDSAPLRMLMIYCKHGVFMSSVRGEMPVAGSIDDPDFQGMLALATKLVIPLQDPFNENRGKERKIGT